MAEDRWHWDRWLSELAPSHTDTLKMDKMLRWLFKQVNWAGLGRDRDRWRDG